VAMHLCSPIYVFHYFSYKDIPTTEIYTLSLHDALPICLYDEGEREVPGARVHLLLGEVQGRHFADRQALPGLVFARRRCSNTSRSEEHTSELQSRRDLVCRLLLEKKKKKKTHHITM